MCLHAARNVPNAANRCSTNMPTTSQHATITVKSSTMGCVSHIPGQNNKAYIEICGFGTKDQQ